MSDGPTLSDLALPQSASLDDFLEASDGSNFSDQKIGLIRARTIRQF
jgi:hypothetical protein